MSTQLLTTKLFIPRAPPRWVARPRLIEQLDGVMARKLALLSAPAGFGKTSLIGAWIRAKNHPIAWISLDTTDRDPLRFITYLVAALQGIQSGVGQATRALLQLPQPPPIEATLIPLINEVSTMPRDFALVLDDYHLIEAPPIHAAITYLLDNLPPPMHVIISTRADPPLPIATLRARDQLTEIRAADLRFAPEETTVFLNQVMDLHLSVEEISTLEARTQGWITGLQLAALSMHERPDPRSLLASFSGSHRYIIDYLAEEVLQRQTEPTQQFLLNTAILERMCASLCESVTGLRDCQTMLDQLVQANVFTVPLDDERRWYRYHQLFADLLQQRLWRAVGTEGVISRHRQASDWYARNGLPADAMRHAQLAGDTDRMISLVRQNLEAMFARSEFNTLLQWMRAIPLETLAARPDVCVGYAWVSLMTGNPDECEQSLDTIELAARTRGLVGDLVELKVVRATLALSRFEISQALELCQTVLPQLIEDRPLVFNHAANLRMVTAYNLALAYEFDGQLSAAQRTFADAARLAREHQNRVILFLALGHLGQLQVVQGHLHAAAEAHRQTLQQLHHEMGEPVAMIALPQAGLGIIMYEWNYLDRALELLQASAALSRLGSNWESATPAAIGLAKCQRARGDLPGALATIDELIALLDRQKARIALPIAQALRAHYWTECGRLDDAAHWAAASRLATEEALDPRREAEYLYLMRVWLALGKTADAEPLAERLLKEAERGERWGRVIEILALQSLARYFCGQPRAALTALQRALELAEPEGYIRTFVDLGEPIRVLLTDLRSKIEENADQMPPDKRRDLLSYASGLLRAYSKPSEPSPTATEALARKPSGLSEPLTEREIDVLRLIVHGLTNQQIAEALSVSLNTVKTHIKNIFGKLGVRNRPQAIGRAGRLNLE